MIDFSPWKQAELSRSDSYFNKRNQRKAYTPIAFKLHMCYNGNQEKFSTKLKEVINLAEKKLIIQPHRYGNESSVISVRLPKDMLAIIDRVAQETGRTRNEIVVLSMEFALENLEIEGK